jgi:uncharacterized protein YjbI with pentapeptide repeats
MAITAQRLAARLQKQLKNVAPVREQLEAVARQGSDALKPTEDLLQVSRKARGLRDAFRPGRKDSAKAGLDDAVVGTWRNRAAFEDVPLRRRDFTPGTSVSGGELANAPLHGLDLRDVEFSYTNLKGADLSNSNLSGADFTWFNELQGANLRGAKLENTTFSLGGSRASDRLETLRGVDLAGAELGDPRAIKNFPDLRAVKSVEGASVRNGDSIRFLSDDKLRNIQRNHQAKQARLDASNAAWEAREAAYRAANPDQFPTQETNWWLVAFGGLAHGNTGTITKRSAPLPPPTKPESNFLQKLLGLIHGGR